MLRLVFLFLFFVMMASCSERHDAHFSKVESSHSHLEFANVLKADYRFNAYTFRNFYNGGAVALGDINNDGLVDIYLTGIRTLNLPMS